MITRPCTQKVCILECRAKFPDLNIIENCWENLVRVMYQNRKQFANINEKVIEKHINFCLEEWLPLLNAKVIPITKQLSNSFFYIFIRSFSRNAICSSIILTRILPYFYFSFYNAKCTEDLTHVTYTGRYRKEFNNF